MSQKFVRKCVTIIEYVLSTVETLGAKSISGIVWFLHVVQNRAILILYIIVVPL